METLEYDIHYQTATKIPAQLQIKVDSVTGGEAPIAVVAHFGCGVDHCYRWYDKRFWSIVRDSSGENISTEEWSKKTHNSLAQYGKELNDAIIKDCAHKSLFVDGLAWREVHEPTYLVREVAGAVNIEDGICRQPGDGQPGTPGKSMVFNATERYEAIAAAQQMVNIGDHVEEFCWLEVLIPEAITFQSQK